MPVERFVDANRILCRAGHTLSGNVSLEVANDATHFSADVLLLSVGEPVIIKTLHPTAGWAFKGAYVTITGTGFREDLEIACSFSGQVVRAVQTNQSRLTCKVPSFGLVGLANFRVVAPGASVAGPALLYEYWAETMITSLLPSGGVTTGGTVVSVVGGIFSSEIVSCR